MAAWDGWEASLRYENGVVTDLGSLSDPPTSTRATDIDDRGVIVGYANTGGYDWHAFVWRDGTIRDLGTLGGRNSIAVAINGKGQILGSSETRTGRSHVVIWQNGRVKDLGRLAPNEVDLQDINDAGQIVGTLADGHEGTGFVWANGRLTVLPPLPGHANSGATAINNQGVIVGWSGPDAGGRWNAVVWSNGKPRALPDLGGGSVEAVDISDEGTIAGNARHPDNSWHAVVWTR